MSQSVAVSDSIDNTRIHDARERPVLLIRPNGLEAIPDHWSPELVGRGIRGYAGGGGTSLAILSSELASMGIDLHEDVICALFMESTTILPRNLSWSALPVIQDRVDETTFRGLCRVGSRGTIHSIHDDRGACPPSTDEASIHDIHEHLTRKIDRYPSTSTTHILIDAPDMDDYLLWACLRPIHEAVLEHGIHVLWFDGRKLSILSSSNVERAVSDGIATDRFETSFMVNWAILHSRIAGHIAIEADWTKSMLRRAIIHPGGRHSALSTPMALQILYALDRIGHMVGPSDFGCGDWIKEVGPPCLFGHDGEGVVFRWIGSGTYDPMIVPIHHSQEDLPFPISRGGYAQRVLRALLDSGLTGMDRDRRMGITRYGRQVLELLGTTLDDPDSLLRWRGPGTADARSMDRWMNKSFRKAKRRVADLSRPQGGIPGENRGVGWACGTTIPLGRKLDDPIVARIVEELVASQRDLPFMARTCGLIESDRVVPEPPTHLWVGVPLGTTKRAMLGPTPQGGVVRASYDDALRSIEPTILLELSSSQELGEPRAICVGAIEEEVRYEAAGGWKGGGFGQDGISVVVGFLGTMSDLSPLLDPHRDGPRSMMAISPGLVVSGRAHETGSERAWWGIEIARMSSDGLVRVSEDIDRLVGYVRTRLAEAARVLGERNPDMVVRPEAMMCPNENECMPFRGDVWVDHLVETVRR